MLPAMRILLASGLILLLTACQSSAPSASSSAGAAPTAGRQTLQLNVQGQARTYDLVVPPRPASAAGHPVVFAFHGAGSTIASLARASGFDTRGRQDGFLVVYPQGRSARFDTRRGSPDVAFVRALLEHLDRQHGVDRARVYATGFSNGGFLSYRLAHDLPGVFAGIAPVAGLLARDALPTQTTTSLLHIHGGSDRVVSASGRGGSLGAEAGVSAWARALGCGAAPTTTRPSVDPSLRIRDVRYGCPQGRTARLIWFDGVGHSWPQGGQGWLSAQIWAFFRMTTR